MLNDINKRKCKNVYHMSSQGNKKHEKMPIVSTPDAIIYPRAVMVKSVYTTVASTAMRTPRWPVELAGCTPFHSNWYT